MCKVVNFHIGQVVNQSTTAVLTSNQKCPDGKPELTDFGDLNMFGPGRVLELADGQFQVNGEKVFLSGLNTPFVNYGKDFGNGYYHGVKKRAYECYLRQVHLAGGNSMRTFVHGKGDHTPEFRQALVIGLDATGSFIPDMRKYLRAAAKNNIVIFLTLWDGRSHHPDLEVLFTQESSLQSYIDKALIPLVKAIKDEPGLGGFDILSETDKLVRKGEASSDPCFDTRGQQHDVNHGYYSMQEILRFISRQADAIHRVDPDIIVTSESYQDLTINEVSKFNHLTDECLLKAGGKDLGYLNFYSTHSTPGDNFHFQHNKTEITLDKAVVLSSFTEQNGNGQTSSEKFEWAYNRGYSGAWSWAAVRHNSNKSDPLETQLLGLESIRSANDSSRGGLVNFSLSEYDTQISE